MIYVGSSGPRNAYIAIVGEGPGANEEAEGRPFVGAAGDELTRMCWDAGIPRQECYVTNAVKFRPPGNDMSEWIYKPKKKDIAPAGFVVRNGKFVRDFVPEHFERLGQELALVKPNVVIALGNTALWALTGLDGIGKWRASILPATLPGIEGMKVIPTYHPANIFREWANRHIAVQDLRRAKDESSFAAIKLPDWHFTIRPSFDKTAGFLTDLLKDLSRGPVKLTCDIETRRRQIACIGFGLSRLDAFCIPVMCVERAEGYWSFEEEWAIIQLIKRVLTHPNTRVINQNFIYDAFYLAALWGFRVIPHFDTMTAQHACFAGEPKSLDHIASLYCRYYRYWKDEGREWRVRSMPEDQLWTYNCMDCTYTFEAAEVLETVIDARKVREQFNFLMAQFEPVLDLMLRGIRTDPDRRNKMAANLQQAIDKRLQWLEQVFGHEVNPHSPQQLAKLFYDDFKVPPIKNRRTGKVTVDWDALDKIAIRQPLLAPATKRIQECRSLNIFKETFVESDGPRDRFFCGVNTSGAHTYRWSSSQNPFGFGTNLQNVPKHEEDEPVDPDFPDVRSLFLPDEDYILAEFDLSKADLHVVVWEADEPELKDMLRKGVNIYKEAGTKVTGMPYGQAKRFIHGTDYGGSARTMAVNCGITVHQSEIAQRRWFGAYPGIKEWHRRVDESLKATHSVINKFGFPRFFFDRIGSIFPEALAWVPQSTVAIVINKAFLRLWQMYRFSYKFQILMQVHDSLLTQIHRFYFDPVLADMHDVFRSIVVPYTDPLIIPFDGKISTKSWGELEKLKPRNDVFYGLTY